MREKKICFIVWGLTAGGQERIASRLANYASKKKYDVTLLLLSKGNHFFKIEDNIQIYEPTLSRDNHNKFVYAFLITLYMRRVLNKVKPDSILVIGEWINSYVLASLWGLKYSIYISNRLSPYRKLSIIHDFANIFFYKRAKGIIAQTNFAAKIIIGKTKASNVKVIPNPVNIIPNNDRVTPNNTILSVGRLAEEKGHKYLIEAFSKINRDGWKLSIVGDGPERKSLENLANELKLDGRVFFHGSQFDLSSYFSEAKIFVLPSLSEGYPNALIEAMAFPLPCISFDCISGPNDIIINGFNGLLVEERNVDELTFQIQHLIDNPIIRENLMKESVIIRNKLSFEYIADKYLDFILAN